ncbi:MAG: hypothetical protein HYY51_01755 [Candidatus Magasanikbacteria bacterium]|nr:hypothetical protein [Candidatus Magasanikbacteria bacterium]
MVKKIEKNQQPAYTCEVCGLNYVDQKIAEQCEAWCAAHQSCNLDIIKHALPEEQK